MKRNSVKLSEVTTYKFGGYCNNYFEIDSDTQLQGNDFESKDYALLILGKGSNLVFSDEGFEGTIIKPNIDFIEFNQEKTTLSLGCSTFLPDIARFSKKNSIANLELSLIHI